jgi:hypothetical protein
MVPTQERCYSILQQTFSFVRELPADVRKSGKCCSKHEAMDNKQSSAGVDQIAVRVHTGMERREQYKLGPCDLESLSAHSAP